MDLDNEDTSELSSVDSEVPSAAKTTTRRTSGRARTAVKASNKASTSAAASKGKQTRRKKVANESTDIAVPYLDEDGNLQDPPEEEEIDELDEDEDEQSESEEEDDEERDADFRGAKSRSSTAGGSRRGRGGRGKAGGGRATTSRAGAATGRGRPRKQQVVEEDGEDNPNAEQAEGAVGAARGKDDFSVEADNNLFNAVKDPRAALEATAEDWLENYRSDEDTRGQALADLVNFVLRCCGCNLSVDMHEAQDLDGVISKLDDIQTDFAKVNQATYPLISKSKGYKKFRSSLQEFLSKLVEATSSSEVLYDDIFCETFQSWLVALSSSKLRAFRHTSTVITLSFVEALCEVSLGNKEAFSQLQRQKEAEVKRSAKIAGKSTRAGATDKTRLQELEAFIKGEHSKKMRLETYFKDIFEAVFIHRYRDAEPAIRMECIRSLGVWMSTLPDHFLEGNYLRYIGWMLTDLDKTVRREAVTSLSALYDKDDYIGSMQHFTERFKARLVEMATSDSELNIRVEAIGVLRQIDRHGLLDEEQRDEVARLIFDAEPRVRRAAAIFFDSILKENLDEKKADYAAYGRRGNDIEHGAEELENMLEWKCLAGMLVKFNSQLDADIAKQLQALEIVDPEEDEDEAEDVETAESAFTRYQKNRNRADTKLRKGNGATSTAQLTAILQGQNKDRMSLAVETLHFEVEVVRNWQSLLNYLLLDHSAAQDVNAQAQAGNAAAPQNQVHAVCRLKDAEETVLLSVFVSTIKTTRDRAKLLSSISDDERDEIYKSTTRAIMNAISRLFAKHQTDTTRCITLLLLPQQMNLDLYLEMRQVTGYEQLWDDITRQFVSHNDLYLLERAMEAIVAFRRTQALSATNADKTTALETAVVEPLRQLIDGIDANNATPLDEDSIKKFTAWLARLCLMLKNWDVSPSLTESGSGNAPTILEAINQLVERGQMGFHEEEKVIQQSLDILYLCYLWRVTRIAPNEPTPDSLVEERNALVQQCQDYAIGELNSASDAVKRTAFRLLLDLQIAAKARHSISEDGSDLLNLSVQTQYRCAGFLQAEIERYASLFDPKGNAGDDLVDENEDDEGNDSVQVEGGGQATFRPVTLAQHAATYAFNDLMVSYARAVCVDVLDLHHASTMLIHYDRFGPFFNECCRWLGDAIRQFGVLGDAGHAAAGVTVESLKGSLELFLAATAKSDSCFTSLARHLSNHLVLRGKGFAIAERLPSEDLVRLHKDLITYTIKKYTRLADQEKHASKNKTLVMFKGLVPCLLGMTGKEAAAIHSHMNEALKEAGLEVSDTSRHWDAQRTYDKRLVTLMSKDTGIKVIARKAVKTRKETDNGANSGNEGEEEENDGSQLPGRGRPKAKPSANAAQAKKAKVAPKRVVKDSRPQALPTRRSNRAAGQENASRYAEQSSDVENDDNDDDDVDPTAAPRRANGDNAAATKTKRLPSPSEHDSDSDNERLEAPKAAGTALPARKGAANASRKRPRDAVTEQDDEDDRPLPPPLASRSNAARSTSTPSLPMDDLTATPASSVRSASEEPVMSLSTQDLRETNSFEFDLPESPPAFDDNQSNAGDDLPRRKRSRY